MTHPDCTRCAQLQGRLDSALQERDQALLELARAREELNRGNLREKWVSEQEVPGYPLEAGAAWPAPLRYRAVDAVNAWAKSTAPGLQRLARSLARRRQDG